MPTITRAAQTIRHIIEWNGQTRPLDQSQIKVLNLIADEIEQSDSATTPAQIAHDQLADRLNAAMSSGDRLGAILIDLATARAAIDTAKFECPDPMHSPLFAALIRADTAIAAAADKITSPSKTEESQR